MHATTKSEWDSVIQTSPALQELLSVVYEIMIKYYADSPGIPKSQLLAVGWSKSGSPLLYKVNTAAYEDLLPVGFEEHATGVSTYYSEAFPQLYVGLTIGGYKHLALIATTAVGHLERTLHWSLSDGPSKLVVYSNPYQELLDIVKTLEMPTPTKRLAYEF